MHHHAGTGRSQQRWPGGLGRLVLAGLLLAGPLLGCAHRREDPGAAGRAAADAEWAWLRSAKQSLDARRVQLAGTRAASRPGTPASPALTALEREVAVRTDELGRRLVDFINADPPEEGEKLSGRRLDAIRMKSDEDIVVAHDFIARGGDYRRAIEIYEAALEIDPDNPRLQQELASARDHRYMSAQRFAQVDKGMTLDQVRDLLGQPNVRDVREFPDRGIVAWFYPRDAEGRAAAVWFAQQNGVYAVYLSDLHAIDVPGAAAPQATPPKAASPAPTPQPGRS